MAIEFIDPDSEAAGILNAILEVAGSNFSLPYDASKQPHDVAEANSDILVQYQFPGGSQIEGHANPAAGGDMGSVINSLIALLAPAVSGYALLLPVLGIIRGIIEILCCIPNPFCLIPAVIRLFVKWLPPFVSLFPPAAGIIILISTMKAIMALIFYILTEIVPTVELMITSMKDLIAFLENPEDLTQAQIDSVKQKLTKLLEMLIQKVGILKVFKPLLELIFLILKLVAGYPCIPGNSDESNASLGSLGVSRTDLELINDSSCCGDLCPPILSIRSEAPRGTGILLPSFFGDCFR